MPICASSELDRLSMFILVPVDGLHNEKLPRAAVIIAGYRSGWHRSGDEQQRFVPDPGLRYLSPVANLSE